MAVEENIFLFVPNIIGYLRVGLTIVSCYFMQSSPSSAFWCYLLGSLLDAVDGHAARYFNQSTKFGAMLDQLTDRCGTAVLMMILAVFYPGYAFLFQVSMATDVSMHWLHLHTSLLQGKGSHKDMSQATSMSTSTEEPPYLLRLYYTSKPVLFTMCAGNELFYITLYLINFYESYFFKFLALVCFPIAVAKWAMAILQGVTAAKNLARIDVAERQAAGIK